MMKKSLIAAALAVSFPAVAQIDPIVIYKTSPLGLNERQTAQSITVISREDIEKSGAATLQEALSQVPGLTMSATTSRSSTGFIRLGGGHQKQVAVYLDGVQITDGRNGYPDLSMMSLSSIDRIEVVKGNSSAQLGNGAIAGAVVLTSRRPAGNAGELSLTAGKFDTHNASVSVGRMSDAGNGFRVTAYDERSAGFDIKAGGSDDKDGFKDRGASLAFSTSTGLGLLDVALSASEGNTEYDDGVNVFDNQALVATLESGKFSTQFNYSDRLKKAEDSNSQTYVIEQTQVQTKYFYDASTVVGASFLTENTDGSTLSTGENANTTALFAEKLFDFTQTQLHLAGRAVNNSDWGTNSALTASFSRKSDSFSPFINFGTAYRAPTRFDIAGYDGNNNGIFNESGIDIQPAPDLDVETSKNVEVGFRSDLNGVQARFALHGTRLKNEIAGGYTWDATAASNDAGTSERYGYDLSLDFPTGPINNSLGLTRSIRVASNGSLNDGFPEYAATYQASAYVADIEVSGSLFHESKRTNQYAANDAFTVANLSGTKALANDLDVTLKVANVFDREYQIAGPNNAQRRNTSVTVKYRF